MTLTPDKKLTRAIQTVDEALALPGDEYRLRELLYHYRVAREEERERLFQALAMLTLTLKAQIGAQRGRTAA